MGLFGDFDDKQIVDAMKELAVQLQYIHQDTNAIDITLFERIHNDLTHIEKELQIANRQSIISNALKVLESQYSNRMFSVTDIQNIEKYYNIVAGNVLQDIKNLEKPNE